MAWGENWRWKLRVENGNGGVCEGEGWGLLVCITLFMALSASTKENVDDRFKI
jgi:hypothetical protein